MNSTLSERDHRDLVDYYFKKIRQMEEESILDDRQADLEALENHFMTKRTHTDRNYTAIDYIRENKLSYLRKAKN